MEHRAGGYTNFREATLAEKKIYEVALHGFVGVGRKILAVATQVVNGTNYAYLCDSKAVHPDSVPYNDLVIIHKPLSGDPHLTEIRRIEIL